VRRQLELRRLVHAKGAQRAQRDPAHARRRVGAHERRELRRDLGAPRLNDRVWLHANDRAAIARYIANPRLGVMPSWGNRLDAATINMLAVYVHALGGGEE
jgi:cytochrome c oxidase cbb3-type subunit 3